MRPLPASSRACRKILNDHEGSLKADEQIRFTAAVTLLLEEAPKLEMLAERQTEPDAPVIERLARAIDDAALQLAANHEN